MWLLVKKKTNSLINIVLQKLFEKISKLGYLVRPYTERCVFKHCEPTYSKQRTYSVLCFQKKSKKIACWDMYLMF